MAIWRDGGFWYGEPLKQKQKDLEDVSKKLLQDSEDQLQKFYEGFAQELYKNALDCEDEKMVDRFADLDFFLEIADAAIPGLDFTIVLQVYNCYMEIYESQKEELNES